MSKYSQEKIISQGCGQIWDSYFPRNNFTKKECYTTNCNYIARTAKVNYCYRYGTIKDANNMILYDAGKYASQYCNT